MFRTIIIFLVLVAAAVGAGFWFYRSHGTQVPSFRTVLVERGDLRAAAGATGTVTPEEVIDVGAQVAGRIDHFGIEPRSQAIRDAMSVASLFHPGDPVALAVARIPPRAIDYSSLVEEGTVLAQLDPRLYQARVDNAAADLAKAKATLQQQEAILHQTTREWERSQSLAASQAVAGTDYDVARSNYETAAANVSAARAAIALAQATLNEASTNLDYTTIRSPVKGVIIDRRVNVGQTVVASLNAPSLFLIAKDLKKMQVWASVNEADIGHIHSGQKVYFTVDSRPGETFVGVVAPGQPRLNASMTNNVVTYTVVVNTDNSSGRLLPYATANLQFVIGERQNVLVVPNSALRWRPHPEYVVPEARDAFAKSLLHRQSRGTVQSAGKAKPAVRMGTVWIRTDTGLVRPVRVQLGLSDGTATEIVAGDLHEDMQVVVGETARQDAGSSSNPFTPSVFGNKKKQA